MGNYYCSTNAISVTLSNVPEDMCSAFTMQIFSATGTPTTNVYYRAQRLTEYKTGVTYFRLYDGYDEVWTDWNCVQGIDSIVAQGISNNMRWKKYASGRAEIVAYSQHVGAINSSYNDNSYKGAATTVALPFPLTGIRIVSGLCGNWHATSIFCYSSNSESFAWFPIASQANATSTLETTGHFMISGYWK